MPRYIQISDLEDSNRIAEMCAKSREPIFITKNDTGKNAMVIMSIETFEVVKAQKYLLDGLYQVRESKRLEDLPNQIRGDKNSDVPSQIQEEKTLDCFGQIMESKEVSVENVIQDLLKSTNNYACVISLNAKNDMLEVALLLSMTCQYLYAARDFLQTINKKINEICNMPITPNDSRYFLESPDAEIRVVIVKRFKIYYNVDEAAKTVNILHINYDVHYEDN